MSRTFLLRCVVLCSLLIINVFPLLPSTGFNHGIRTQVHPVKAAADEESQITLAQIAAAAGKPTQFSALQSPMDRLAFQFSLPPEWELEEGARLDLSLSSLIASMMPSQGEINYDQIVGGVLSIVINGKTIETIPIQGNGKKNFAIQLPNTIWQVNAEEHVHTLEFQWDASTSCNFNLLATVTIDPGSSLWLPHRTKPLELNIAQFPAPLIIKNAIFQPPLTLIISDQPTAAELEAAFTISGGLSQLSHGMAQIELSAPKEITEQQLSQHHLIIIGNAWQTPPLKEKLSSSLQSNPIEKGALIQLISSPWNSSRGLLLLQAQNEQSLITGAYAISRGELLASETKTTSIILQEPASTKPRSFAEDTTLAALGIKDTTISRFGTTTIQIPVNIPPESKIGAEAYFDLVFNHSQVADYLRSAIVVRLNNIPIGSVRFSDSTANLSTLRAMLPPTILRPGPNELQIQVDLYPRQLCTDERSQNLWVTLFSNSFLHLPTVKEASTGSTQTTIGSYPYLFSDPEKVALILPQNRPAAIQASFRFSQILASQNIYAFKAPKVLYTDSIGSSPLPQNQLFFIGLPQDFIQLPPYQALFSALFNTDNTLSQTVQTYLPFKISPPESVGYLGIVHFRNQPLLMIVSGNNDQGMNNAVNALLNPRYQDSLNSGNFAVIQENKLIPINLPIETQQQAEVRSAAGEEEQTGKIPAESSAEVSTEPSLDYNKPEPWLLPTIIGSTFLIFIIIGYKIFSSVSQSSKKPRL